jgi:hypothetical protein
MSRAHGLIVAALVALAAAPGCGEETEPPVYGLIWQDEFDGPAGQLPDANKWRFDLGTDWGNLQLEYDTNRAENCSLDGLGNLAITAREEEYQNQRVHLGAHQDEGPVRAGARPLRGADQAAHRPAASGRRSGSWATTSTRSAGRSAARST